MLQRFAAVVVFLSCGAAFAGATVTMHAQRGDSTLLLEGNKLRTEDLGQAHGGDVMIFDGDKQEMYLIETKSKSYTLLTPALMKAKLGEASAQMKSSMAKMPPEQKAQMKAAMERMDPETRKKMEAMMNGGSLQDNAVVQKVRYEKTGKRQTVAGFPCEGYRQLVGDEVQTEGCFIPWSAGAVKKSDLGSLEKMREFIKEGGQGMLGGSALAQLGEMPGFPGEMARRKKDGTEENQMTLTAIKQGSLSADQFKVPAGYTRQEMGHGERH